MTRLDPIVIVGAARTPLGAFQGELKDFSARVAGGVIAFYQVGYGVAAFGVGPLLAGGVSLPQIYAAAAVIAAILGGWSFRVAGRQPNPTSLHPHLGHRG